MALRKSTLLLATLLCGACAPATPPPANSAATATTDDAAPASPAPAAPGRVYGAASSLPGAPLTLAQAIAAVPAGGRVKVEGSVSEVCAMKGCWMVLTEGALAVRTTFKDYGFFVPKNLSGRVVVAEGTLAETVTPEAEARHYAEDGGASPEEISRIVGDQKGWTLLAESVTVVR